MAKFLNKTPTNITEYPNSFKRQGPFPLEAYELFYSLESAQDYARNGSLAYVGQEIKVVSSGSVDSYLIMDEAGTLGSVLGDNFVIDGGTALDADPSSFA
jgi:hypothetical protein